MGVGVWRCVGMCTELSTSIRLYIPPFDQDIYKYAREMIGQMIYVGWPYLTEAYLWALSDRKTK